MKNPPTNPPYDSSAFREITSDLASRRDELAAFTKIKDMPEGEPWALLRALYGRSDFESRAMATILNGVATDRRTKFLLSYRLLIKYFTLDPNSYRASLKSTEWKRLKESKRLVCLIEPTRGFKDGRASGLYSISPGKTTDLLDWWPKETVQASESDRLNHARSIAKTKQSLRQSMHQSMPELEPEGFEEDINKPMPSASALEPQRTSMDNEQNAATPSMVKDKFNGPRPANKRTGLFPRIDFKPGSKAQCLRDGFGGLVKGQVYSVERVSPDNQMVKILGIEGIAFSVLRFARMYSATEIAYEGDRMPEDENND